MTTDPPSLKQVLSQVEILVRRAYADGYREGSQDAAERMMRAVSNNVDQRLPPVEELLTPKQSSRSGIGEPRANSPYGYGTVINVFRQAIYASQDAGMTKENILEFCHRLNLDITTNTYRDTMKRLVGGEEVVRRHGAYFPGRLLRTDLLDTRVSRRPERFEMRDVQEGTPVDTG